MTALVTVLASTTVGGWAAALVLAVRWLEERARRRSGILLPGWRCRACQAFNGAEKELLAACRCCGRPR